MSNYVSIPYGTRQAWGVAAREEHLLKWCYENGPDSYKSYTERAARLEAFQSNNQDERSHYVVVPIPGRTATYDIAETFDPGPIGEKRAARAVEFRKDLLRRFP